MSIRAILQVGNPKLKAKNKIVKNIDNLRIRKIIQDLIDTMNKNDLVGIAAPQIGENYQIFITEPRKTKTRTVGQTDELRVYINPKITSFSKEKIIMYEGCGSVVHGELFAPVKRPKQVTIDAYDKNTIRFQLVCDGLLSRVIQHEYDHLSGIEFTEKISDYRKILSRKFYIKEIKTSKTQIRASKITLKQYSEI